MNRSLLIAATTLGFILIACSGASSGDDDLGSADDELSAVKACQGKSCGESCKLCPPGKPNCFETAVLKACNAQGKCSATAPQCGGAVDAGPAPYEPCAGKTCGDSCSLCGPNDPNCFETAVLKFCHADGSCKDVAPACAPPSPYDPCANKACGASCSVCPPNDPNCVETAVLKFCHADGQCKPTTPACTQQYQPCANKACGEACTICNPADPNCFETAVLKACDAQGQCTPNNPVCK